MGFQQRVSLRRTVRFACAAALSLSWLAVFAAFPIHSQRNPVYSSLDESIARADQVVVGRIIDFGTATYDKSGRGYQQPFVVAVEETLKGADVQRLSLDLGLVTWMEIAPHFDWKLPFSHGDDSLIHSHRLLIAQRFSEPPYPPHSDVFDLDSGGLSVVTADLTVLTKPEDIIRAAKDDIRRTPMKVKPGDSFTWVPPQEPLKETAYYGCAIVVPIDERLEKRAHTLLSEPGNKNISEGHLVALGAIRFFKSDDNIRLLKGLLNDSDLAIRREASVVLKSWGVDAAEPVAH